MSILIKCEELLLACLGFYLFLALDYPWWWFFALLLTPDVSMLAYVFGPSVGAWSYNLVHHRGVAVALFVLGAYVQREWLQLVGIVMLSHSSLDRVFGYGLKYTDSFQHTHLGRIGRSRKP